MTRSLSFFAMLLIAPLLWAAAQPSVAVRTAPAKKQQLRKTITLYGVVSPDPQALTTEDAVYAAFVRKLYVSPGQPIQKGDPLIELRTAPSARQTWLNARANVRFASEAVARQRKLLGQHLATHANVNAAEQTLAQAQAALNAQKELGTDRLTRVIKAPFDGIVSQLPVKPGSQVAAGTPLFQLTERGRLQVALGVEPDEVGRLHEGMPVSVTAVFGDNAGVASTLAKINAVVDPATRLVDAIVRLEGPKARPFLPGMRVQGLVTLATRESLTVPRPAVLHDNRGDYLFLVRGGTAHRVNVKLGLEHGDSIAVSGNIEPGDTVVIEGNYELSDGMAVRQSS